MKKNSFLIQIILISITFLSSLLIAEEEKDFQNDIKNIESLLKEYFKEVDKKNTDGLFFYYDLPVILHFNSSIPTTIYEKKEFDEIFNVWKNSNNGNYSSTKIDSLSLTEIRKNFICVADITYSRLNAKNEVTQKKRSLYHLVKKEKNDSKWKIYMITSIELIK